MRRSESLIMAIIVIAMCAGMAFFVASAANAGGADSGSRGSSAATVAASG